ncbi:MAG: biotin--[acetyl-CoA-carboxylase] ligase [Dehalococcoidia bacterium]
MVRDDFSANTIRSSLRTKFMGRQVFFYETLPTTMEVADEKAREGAPEGTAVVADHQTAGRGRFGRSWLSPKGGTIAVSIILRPRLEELPKLNMVASLGIARSIERCCGLAPRIKWPNDVLVGRKKVSGILITSAFQRDRLEYATAGIGINVNIGNRILSQISPPATSLYAELGHTVSRLQVFRSLMEELEALYLSVRAGESLLHLWEPYVATLGQHVQVQWRREDVEGYMERGYAESVDEEGRLLLRLPDGTLKTLVAGEVTLQSEQP